MPTFPCPHVRQQLLLSLVQGVVFEPLVISRIQGKKASWLKSDRLHKYLLSFNSCEATPETLHMETGEVTGHPGPAYLAAGSREVPPPSGGSPADGSLTSESGRACRCLSVKPRLRGAILLLPSVAKWVFFLCQVNTRSAFPFFAFFFFFSVCHSCQSWFRSQSNHAVFTWTLGCGVLSLQEGGGRWPWPCCPPPSFCARHNAWLVAAERRNGDSGVASLAGSVGVTSAIGGHSRVTARVGAHGCQGGPPGDMLKQWLRSRLRWSEFLLQLEKGRSATFHGYPDFSDDAFALASKPLYGSENTTLIKWRYVRFRHRWYSTQMKRKQRRPQVSGARKLSVALTLRDVNERASLLGSRNSLFSNVVLYSNLHKGTLCVSLLMERHYFIINTFTFRKPVCLSKGFLCLPFFWSWSGVFKWQLL